MAKNKCGDYLFVFNVLPFAMFEPDNFKRVKDTHQSVPEIRYSTVSIEVDGQGGQGHNKEAVDQLIFVCDGIKHCFRL